MPKNRKTQVVASKKPRTGEPLVNVEDGSTGAEPSTSATYEVSEAETALGASSVEGESFVTPLPVPVVPAPRVRTTADSATPADAANLLFNPPAGSIHPDIIRGRTDQLCRRVEQTLQATLQSLDPRPVSPPRPGIQGETFSTAQLLSLIHI